MQTVRTVYLVGKGAVGMTLALQLAKNPSLELAFICDPERKEKYEKQPARINGKQVSFRLITPGQPAPKADLILFACKSYSFEQAMEEAAPFVCDQTILVSALNGISSEQQLAKRFSRNPVVHAIAQKMDSCYDARTQVMEFTTPGELVIGAASSSAKDACSALEDLFEKSGFSYRRSDTILLDQYRKLTANCALNQICALYDITYGDIAGNREYLALFEEAMREVRLILAADGKDPGEECIEEWVDTIRKLSPDSMPSMAQDMKAGRKIEIELFSETILEIAGRHGMDAPIQRRLHDGLLEKMRTMDKGPVEKTDDSE